MLHIMYDMLYNMCMCVYVQPGSWFDELHSSQIIFRE